MMQYMEAWCTLFTLHVLHSESPEARGPRSVHYCFARPIHHRLFVSQMVLLCAKRCNIAGSFAQRLLSLINHQQVEVMRLPRITSCCSLTELYSFVYHRFHQEDALNAEDARSCEI